MERTNRERTRSVFTKIITCIILSVLLIITIIFICIPAEDNVFAYGTGYAVMNVDDGKCILESNATIRLPMASTTKIMTALVIVENCDPDEIVKIDDRAIGIEGSSVYLRKGEQLSVRELLYCMMLRSGNDSAVALALHMADSVESFADIMNIRAESMGLQNTHFMNPHGLHDEQHYTSAYDLGKIAATAMKNELFSEIVRTRSIIIGKGESTRQLLNKNKMLHLYPDANGIKTGYTKKSGRCLVSSATRNGTTLVCVVLNDGDTYGVSMKLLDEGFRLIEAQNA